MNGFPLVILGVALFALAYSLLKIQGKISEITKAVNLGFKTIEDGISKNLLDPNSGFSGVSKAVDQNFKTIEDGITESVLGPKGALVMVNGTLVFARDVFYQASTDIHGGRVLLTTDVCQTIGECQTILDDVGRPLVEAGTWIYGIGDALNVEILDGHPFAAVAKPFHDVGTTVDNVGDKCVVAEDKLGDLTLRVTDAALKLDSLSNGVYNIGEQVDSLNKYIDNTLRPGVQKSVIDIEKVRVSVDAVLISFKTGVEGSLKELENARTYLDSLLSKMVNKQWIATLAVAGIVLILTGVSIGV
jgi:hypothetical protein